MDPRLQAAATTGNTNVLVELYHENSDILVHNVTTDSWDTALHIAALFGHRDFLEKVLELSPELARKLNRQGESPLHLAAAKGHLEVVAYFLAFDASLCLLKDLEGMVPLQLAANKGNILVLEALFLSCPDSAMERTDGGYNVLFLAVKNNHYRVLETLIRHITNNDIYKAIDDEGNTILHHACKGKRLKMVKLLMNENTINKISVNLVNSEGFTALDVIVTDDETESSARREIEKILRQAGGQQTVLNRNSFSAKIEKLIDSLKNGIVTMASVFIASTFEMALNPPGGFWQEFAPDRDPNIPFAFPRNVRFSPSNLVFIPVKFWGISLHYLPKVPPGSEHRPGKAINRELHRVQFFAFLAYDAVIFMISILMILMVAAIEIFPVSKSIAAGFLFLLMFSLIIFAGLLYRSGVALATDMQVSQWVIYGAFYNIVVGSSIYLFLFLAGRYAWSFYRNRKVR